MGSGSYVYRPVDKGTLPMNSLGSLAGLFPGEILVVGGGMQTLKDLRTLGPRNFSCVISANGHAFKIPGLKVDYIVCKDHKHTETGESMEKLLSVHHTPIISRQWWADFRAADWTFQGNSGLMAIAVAAVLGGGPIYPIGFDFYQEGTYWHDPNAKNVSRGRSTSSSRVKALQLAEYMFGTQIRPISGPLTQVFKPFQPGSFLNPYLEPSILRKYREQKGYFVRCKHPFTFAFDPRAQIVPGSMFWVSEAEYATPLTRQHVEIVDIDRGM
jgi:hypothetical protein